MASYSDKIAWWADWRCDTSKYVGVTFPGWATPLPVADAAAPAFEVFANLMRKHGYLFRESAGGTYNCRKIAGTNSWSLHAYAIAIDLNPSVNKFKTIQHDYPQGFIDDVLATGLFKWGITFANKDPMHWEIDVPPTAIGDDMSDPRISDWEAKTLGKIHAAFDEKNADVDNIQRRLIDRAREGGSRWTRKQIAAIAAASAAGGATAAEVIEEIVRRLGG